jgi:hypothetical protein
MELFLWNLKRFDYIQIWANHFYKKNDEIFIFYEYIYQKIIYVIKYEKWEIYFKSGVVSDFLHETLGGDHEWCW